jgi:hypothetical protein
MNDLLYTIQCTVDNNRSFDSTKNYFVKISFIDDIISAQIGGKRDPIIASTSDQLIDNILEYFKTQHEVLNLEAFEANEVDDIKDHIIKSNSLMENARKTR